MTLYTFCVSLLIPCVPEVILASGDSSGSAEGRSYDRRWPKPDWLCMKSLCTVPRVVKSVFNSFYSDVSSRLGELCEAYRLEIMEHHNVPVIYDTSVFKALSQVKMTHDDLPSLFKGKCLGRPTRENTYFQYFFCYTASTQDLEDCKWAGYLISYPDLPRPTEWDLGTRLRAILKMTNTVKFRK